MAESAGSVCGTRKRHFLNFADDLMHLQAMNNEDFRKFGHALIDWIADYRERARLGEFPVVSRAAPGELKRALPREAPQQPESMDQVLRDLSTLILPACTHWQDPRFFAYFPSNSSLAGVLGDFVSTGLAQLGLNWQASPALTELEEVTTDWFRQMLGLSSAWSGVIQDTASTSTLVALICARERTSASNGVVYTSSQAHSSVEKGVKLAGFPRENLRFVDLDENYAMRPDALEAAIEADLARGLRPSAIVATTGTTATTALDPIGPIARIARRHGIWLHVDAALAGAAMILPECRGMWEGIEDADSIVVNAHKWLGAPFDCSLYYVRDPGYLMQVMSTSPSYLRTAADSEVKNYRDWGIPLGRRFRALKLWYLLREQGVAQLQARLRRDIEHARWLAAQVDATPHWKRLAPVPFQTVCVRHEPPGLEGEALDAHTLAWVQRINQSGKAYLTSAMLDGRWMVRVAFGGEATEREHVVALWALMQEEAARAS